MDRIILIITLLLITSAHSLFSQSITNVQAKAEGNTVVVSYHLQSSNSMAISLYVSEDGGRTFTGPLKNVRGDVGTVIQQGSKRIVWDVLNERDFVHSSNMVFRVKAASPFGTFRDQRDGKTYKTVKIGKQVWMAENIAYETIIGNYLAYGNNKGNVAKYGYLYDWHTAKHVCPPGWHLPSDAEWEQLTDYVGSNAGTKLKAKSGWSSNSNGTDVYGFSALPGGLRDTRYISIGDSGYWWSSTDIGWRAYSRDMGPFDYVHRDASNKDYGLSVRCVRD